MHHHHGRAGRDHLVDKAGKQRVVVIVVHAQAALDGDRHVGGRAHGRDALGHQRRLAHQAGAETPGLHTVGGATAVEIDLIKAPLLRNRRRLREQGGIAAAQLQRQRMFHRIEADQAGAIAVDHRVGVHHLGVQARGRRQQAVEDPAMAVGPIHHRSDGQAQGGGVAIGGSGHRRSGRSEQPLECEAGSTAYTGVDESAAVRSGRLERLLWDLAAGSPTRCATGSPSSAGRR